MLSMDEIISRAGGVTQLAKLVGVNHATISASWRRSGRIPVERALLIHEHLNIPLHELRPDVWRPEPEAA
jgi:DNA-binding transcriptional regulator YdaS (Cro superfamily)